MRRSLAISVLTTAILLAAGCRVPVESFRHKSEVLPADVQRIVLFRTEPGPGRDSFYETRDPRLIARLVEGLQFASRPFGEGSLDGLSQLYIVPRAGKPLYFGIALLRSESLYGPRLASALRELTKVKPIPYSLAEDTGRTDLTEIRGKAR